MSQWSHKSYLFYPYSRILMKINQFIYQRQPNIEKKIVEKHFEIFTIYFKWFKNNAKPLNVLHGFECDDKQI